MADRDAKLDHTTTIGTVPETKKKRRWGWKLGLLGLLLFPALLFAVWIAITLGFSYSSGERVGYLQKFSEKGWLCKTWEGELAMATMPGVMPEVWRFSVRDDDVAQQLKLSQGKRVAVAYKEHKGVPTSCFGETPYFASGVRSLPQP